MPSNSSPAMLRWLSVRQHMEGCGHVHLSCSRAYSKESRLMLQTCECHFRVVCSWWADWCCYHRTSSNVYNRSTTPGLLVFISISFFSSKKLELFLKKGDVFTRFYLVNWLFYPALELSIFATFATAEMCTAAADNCTPLLCNKQFGKMHSLSSILTLLLVSLTIVAWMKGPSPTVLRST